jgi:DNA-binding transcriptional LysR family regulator
VRFATQQVRAGNADIAISGPLGTDGLDQRPIGSVRMVPVAAPHHPLALTQGPSSKGFLESQVHLVLTDGVERDAAPSEGFASPRRWLLQDASTRLTLLRAGLGWARLPDHEADLECDAGRLVPLDTSIVPVRVDRVPLCVATARAARLGKAGRWVYDNVAMG